MKPSSGVIRVYCRKAYQQWNHKSPKKEVVHYGLNILWFLIWFQVILFLVNHSSHHLQLQIAVIYSFHTDYKTFPGLSLLSARSSICTHNSWFCELFRSSTKLTLATSLYFLNHWSKRDAQCDSLSQSVVRYKRKRSSRPGQLPAIIGVPFRTLSVTVQAAIYTFKTRSVNLKSCKSGRTCKNEWRMGHTVQSTGYSGRV